MLEAAAEWRARGFAVDAFVDAASRPALRDSVLPSSGYREVSLLCVHGLVALTTHEAPTERLVVQGATAPLRVGAQHAIRNVQPLDPSSWLILMR